MIYYAFCPSVKIGLVLCSSHRWGSQTHYKNECVCVIMWISTKFLLMSHHSESNCGGKDHDKKNIENDALPVSDGFTTSLWSDQGCSCLLPIVIDNKISDGGPRMQRAYFVLMYSVLMYWWWRMQQMYFVLTGNWCIVPRMPLTAVFGRQPHSGGEEKGTTRECSHTHADRDKRYLIFKSFILRKLVHGIDTFGLNDVCSTHK